MPPPFPFVAFLIFLDQLLLRRIRYLSKKRDSKPTVALHCCALVMKLFGQVLYLKLHSMHDEHYCQPAREERQGHIRSLYRHGTINAAPADRSSEFSGTRAQQEQITPSRSPLQSLSEFEPSIQNPKSRIQNRSYGPPSQVLNPKSKIVLSCYRLRIDPPFFPPLHPLCTPPPKGSPGLTGQCLPWENYFRKVFMSIMGWCSFLWCHPASRSPGWSAGRHLQFGGIL